MHSDETSERPDCIQAWEAGLQCARHVDSRYRLPLSKQSAQTASVTDLPLRLTCKHSSSHFTTSFTAKHESCVCHVTEVSVAGRCITVWELGRAFACDSAGRPVCFGFPARVLHESEQADALLSEC